MDGRCASELQKFCYAGGVQVSESIQCPFCGQSFELIIDTSTASQRFTTDCEVCCRPFEVVAECEPGEILSLDVLGS
jgi:Cysteine-rich CPXCG